MDSRYEIKGRIARGGVGAVYEAYDFAMDRPVAIKRLLPPEEARLAGSAGSETLAREFDALVRLRHPNVVSVFEFGEDEEGPYVVYELVRGETLDKVAGSAALSPDEFVEFARQALGPLVAAEELHLLHRDIKPGNIMLAALPEGGFRVKLLDFGMAKFSEFPSPQTLDLSGTFLGSIDYVSPEQVEARPLDQRTDLYSLGCVCYFALARRAPFAGRSEADTLMRHLEHRVEPIGESRPDLDPALSAWVMRLISRRTCDRPRTASEALRALEEVATGNGTEAERESCPVESPAMPSPLRRSRRPILPAAAPRRRVPPPRRGRRPAGAGEAAAWATALVCAGILAGGILAARSKPPQRHRASAAVRPSPTALATPAFPAGRHPEGPGIPTDRATPTRK